MIITYDARADAVMILLDRGKTEGGHSCFPPQWKHKSSIEMDFNANDQLIRIEILYASRVLPQRVLQQAKQIDGIRWQDIWPEAQE